MSIFLELINLYFIVPRVPCRQGWGFLDWSQKQHYEKGTFSTIALVDCPCWQHGLAFTVGKFLTVIFCSAGRMPQLFRVWNLWLLSNLCMTVSLSMHAARVSEPCSFLLRNHRTIAPPSPWSILGKATGQCASHRKYCRNFHQEFPAKLFFCASCLTTKQIYRIFKE